METLKFIRNIRLAAMVLYVVGLFANNTWLLAIGACAWMCTYLYTIGRIEEAYYNALDQQRAEADKSDGGQSDDGSGSEGDRQ